MWSLLWRSSSSISELEASLTIYEPLVWISGAIVLVGVVLEVVCDRPRFKNNNNAETLKKWGEYLLIIGLAGEISFGIATSTLSDLVIAKLHQETSRITQEAVELEAEIQPRDLSADQQRAIGQSIRNFSGDDIPLLMTWYRLDIEGGRLSREIEFALGLGGIGAHVVPGDLDRYADIPEAHLSTPLSGVHVLVGRKWQPFGDALVRSLESTGKLAVSIDVLTPVVGRQDPFNAAYIFVGMKPIPQLK